MFDNVDVDLSDKSIRLTICHHIDHFSGGWWSSNLGFKRLVQDPPHLPKYGFEVTGDVMSNSQCGYRSPVAFDRQWCSRLMVIRC